MAVAVSTWGGSWSKGGGAWDTPAVDRHPGSFGDVGKSRHVRRLTVPRQNAEVRLRPNESIKG
jgi:hypothetical protein